MSKLKIKIVFSDGRFSQIYG